ncbi:hypothetical protein M9Y10_033557 [Tritrichomonas musculus]|uniref:L-type lectin-like domain-containing protein n=1 Tax=Tritrichomonas musculus TaxID=1915356 RepID=A0ABR2KCG8_9EUKA
MIFLLFTSFSTSLIDKTYSLIPPFLHSSVGEIGNWSIRGQAVSQKKMIHLTSTIGNKNGGLCQLTQTNANDWESEIEMSFIGDTFIFTFGPQLCPNISARFFNGLNLSFTPSDKNPNTVNVRLSGPEIFPSTTCSFQYNYHPNKIKIRISKEDYNISLYTTIDSGETKKCLSHKIGSIYTKGYFSLFAFSPNAEKCNNSCITNIYSETFFPVSEIKYQQDFSIIERNRKYLDENKKERQLLKMIRRARMMTVSKYLDDIQNHNGVLDGNTFHDNDNFKSEHIQYNIDDKFSDSLLETKEMVIRARDAISAENLTNFINNKMMPTVDRAAARFERVSDALWNMKSEMLSLWEDVSKELKTMNFDIRNDCELVQNEVVGVAKTLKQHLLSIDNETTEFPKNINTDNSAIIEKILFIICIFEFIAYVIFFIRYHNQVIRKNV